MYIDFKFILGQTIINVKNHKAYTPKDFNSSNANKLILANANNNAIDFKSFIFSPK